MQRQRTRPEINKNLYERISLKNRVKESGKVNKLNLKATAGLLRRTYDLASLKGLQ